MEAPTHCPKCGKELGQGATRCWTKGCDYVLGAEQGNSRLLLSESKERLRGERIAFILIASIAIGVTCSIYTEAGLIAGTIIAALSICGVFVLFEGGLGGLLIERVPKDKVAPNFDWKQMLIEPLIFILAALGLLLAVGVVMLIKKAFSE